jgi:hypothetical protein
MTNKVETYVPAPGDYVMTHSERVAYLAAQGLLEVAIGKLGLEKGISLTLSGITRELRRHMSVEEIQQTLRGFADSMPQAAAYDDPSLGEKTNG